MILALTTTTNTVALVAATWLTWMSFSGAAVIFSLAAGALAYRRAESRLRSVPDEDFVLEEPLRGLARDAILEERRWLAKKLCVPPSSLSSEVDLGDLADLEFLPGGTISVALGDLDFELIERFPDEQDIPRLERELSVGELVAWLASRSK